MYRTSMMVALARKANAAPASDSASIGPDGGELRLPGLGLRIAIPRGALKETSSVHVTAHPQVLGFTVTMTPEQPLLERATIEQELHGQVAAIADLGDGPVIIGHVDVVAREDSKCSALFLCEVRGTTAHARVPHFSGYIFASGIQAGAPCDPATDGPTCVLVDDQ